MNATIPPSAEIALRKHVERAVRPIRSGRDRKLAMREELFAHLTAIYTEELPQQPHEQAALSAALRRFGDPASLTAELNGSLGLADKYGYYGELVLCFSPYSGEPLVRFALRLFFALGLSQVILIIAAALLHYSLVGSGWDDPTKLALFPNLLLLMLVGEVATVVATWDICRTFSRDRRWSRWFWACLRAIVWSLVVIGMVALFWWSITGTFTGFHRIAGRAAVWGVAGLAAAWGPLPFALLLSGWVLHVGQKYRQKYEAWTTLSIDE